MKYNIKKDIKEWVKKNGVHIYSKDYEPHIPHWLRY